MSVYEPVRVKTLRGTLLDGKTVCEPTQELAKDIDWNNSSDRKWLMNHLHWSMLNGREVRLFASHRAPRTIS